MEHGDIEKIGTAATTGDVLYFDGTEWVKLAAGTSGDVITSGGAGVAPSYVTPTGTSFIGWYGSGTPTGGAIVPATPRVCDNIVEIFDIGGLFDATTGLLTETVDAYWQLNCNIRLRTMDISASAYSLQLQGGSDTIGNSYDPRRLTGDPSDIGFSISGTFHILNGETAFCEVTQTGGATQTTIDHCYFSGHRIALA